MRMYLVRWPEDTLGPYIIGEVVAWSCDGDDWDPIVPVPADARAASAEELEAEPELSIALATWRAGDDSRWGRLARHEESDHAIWEAAEHEARRHGASVSKVAVERL
jgi:hypothetical protein